MKYESSNGYFEKINAVLKNLRLIRTSRYSSRIRESDEVLKGVEFIEEKTTYTMPDGEEQGGSNKSYEIYKIPYLGGVYLKINIETDSYGSGEHIQGVSFVKPQQKTITVYE